MATAALEGPAYRPNGGDVPVPAPLRLRRQPARHHPGVRRRRRSRSSATGRGSSTTPGCRSARTSRSTACATARHIDMRVWERGVGETRACGSGACAVAVAAVLDGQVERTVDVRLAGRHAHDRGRGRPRDPPDRAGRAHRARRARRRPRRAGARGLMRGSRRLAALPEYLTARTNRLSPSAAPRAATSSRSASATPTCRRRAAARARWRSSCSATTWPHYPTNRGLPELREAVARFYRARFGVELDPEREIVPLLGAKEGLAHLALAQLDPGDAALVADPGYPVYVGGPTLAGADPVPLPLTARARLPARPRRRGAARPRARQPADPRLPQQPDRPPSSTSGSTSGSRRGGSQHGVPICHDNAYSEITFDGVVAPSFLEAPGAREAGIEILSLSKAFSMPGWRDRLRRRQRRARRQPAAAEDARRRGHVRRPAARRDRPPGQRSRPSGGRWRPSTSAVATSPCERLRGRRRATSRARGGGMYVWMPVPGGDDEAFSERLLLERRRRRLARQRLRRRRRRLRAAGADGARRPPGGGHGAARTRALSGVPTARACSGFTLPRLATTSHTVRDADPERALIIAVLDQGDDGRGELDEMRELLRTAGCVTVGEITQHRDAARSAHLPRRRQARRGRRRDRRHRAPRRWSATTSSRRRSSGRSRTA